jgi:hypothetical protein
MKRFFRAFTPFKDGKDGQSNAKIRIGMCAMDKKVCRGLPPPAAAA